MSGGSARRWSWVVEEAGCLGGTPSDDQRRRREATALKEALEEAKEATTHEVSRALSLAAVDEWQHQGPPQATTPGAGVSL
jgi:hypothetical protein